MFRYDRFNAEVKRVGKKNVIDGLFNGGANSSPNNYMKDGSNPSCDKIEAFCRFFGRPVSFFVDLSDGEDDGKDFGRFANEPSNYLEEAEIKLAHAKEKEDLLRKIIQSKDEIISILNDEIARLRKSNGQIK